MSTSRNYPGTDILLDALADTYDPDAEPAPYVEGPQDTVEGLGAGVDSPNSPREAVATGYRMVKDQTFVGAGMCLRTIRTLFQVAALYPDAETAWEEAEHRHRVDRIADLQPWTPIWWTNGRHGHVALDLKRDGLCLTTDYVRTGYLGVARIADLGPWCGGTLRGWSEDINAVRIWSKPDPFGRDDKIRIVSGALERARKRNRSQAYLDDLGAWLDNIRKGA